MLNEQNLLKYRKYLINLIDSQTDFSVYGTLFGALKELDKTFNLIDNEGEKEAIKENEEPEVFKSTTLVTVAEKYKKENKNEK